MKTEFVSLLAFCFRGSFSEVSTELLQNTLLAERKAQQSLFFKHLSTALETYVILTTSDLLCRLSGKKNRIYKCYDNMITLL